LFKNLNEEDKPEHPSKSIIYIIIVGLIVFIPPFLVYYPFRKKWNKLYPKYMVLFGSKKIMEFYPKDYNEKKKYFEIPYFENICLEYKAIKDFSKYLDYIEIREYPFKYYYKHKRKNKKMVNEWIWYARFYYSQKPKKGKLGVVYI